MNEQQDQHSLAVEDRESLRRFTRWALASLGLDLHNDGEQRYWFDVPEDLRSYFNGSERVHFTTNYNSSSSSKHETNCIGQSLGLDEPLLKQIADRIRAEGPGLHAMPARQTITLPALSSRLFSAYSVQGGTVHLAGCTLEDRPFACCTYRYRHDDHPTTDRLVQVYASEGGPIVDVDQIRSLGLDNLIPFPGKPPHLDKKLVRRLAEYGRRVPNSAHESYVHLATTLVWCKFTEGKLLFTIGDHSTELRFSGWAQSFLDNRIQPPPFLCTASNRQTYHLAATDDGRLVAAESIANCQITGRRVVDQDLVTCAVTGRRAVSELFVTCPVTGDRVLSTESTSCSTCLCKVSPTSVRGHLCRACRSLKPVRKDDPRMARLLGEHPGLDRWARWKISETADVYVLTAGRLLQKLLVVVDKINLDPLRLATSGRFQKSWADAGVAQRDELLR